MIAADAPDRPIVAAALPADTPALARTLARAFHDDPVFCWLLPDAATRTARMTRLFTLLIGFDAKSGRIIKGAGNHAASIWKPPGTAMVPFSAFVLNLPTLLGVFGTQLMRSMAVSDAIKAHMPKDRAFWYVHFVGVDPAYQGHGWGRAMMRRGLEFARADGLPTYLETARPENVAFYRGLGFTVLSEWNVPRGPHFWSLLHEG